RFHVVSDVESGTTEQVVGISRTGEPAPPVHAIDRRVTGFAREVGILAHTYRREGTGGFPGIFRRGISRLLVETLRPVVDGRVSRTGLRGTEVDRPVRIEVPPAAPWCAGPGRITGSRDSHTVSEYTATHASAVCEDLVDGVQRRSVAVPGALDGDLRTKVATGAGVGIPAKGEVTRTGVRRFHYFAEEIPFVPVRFTSLAVLHADQHVAAVVGEVGTDEHADLVLLAIAYFVHATAKADLHAFIVVTEAD